MGSLRGRLTHWSWRPEAWRQLPACSAGWPAASPPGWPCGSGSAAGRPHRVSTIQVIAPSVMEASMVSSWRWCICLAALWGLEGQDLLLKDSCRYSNQSAWRPCDLHL